MILLTCMRSYNRASEFMTVYIVSFNVLPFDLWKKLKS